MHLLHKEWHVIEPQYRYFYIIRTDILFKYTKLFSNLLSQTQQKWNIIALRYFNPVGAHPSGRLGEDPTKNFTNLMPYIGQVAIGKKPSLTIFGNDYDTVDGTGMVFFIWS